ncbi:MAG TPA: GH116 family glycosyl hydrolase, partial [Cyclobacteriaceae bacterium]|nr:GH116 family glycosyl hydrolase [Cyclobacteriaceae bacterium]
DFAVFTDQPETVIDHCWFRGGWFDPLTIAWETIQNASTKSVDPVPSGAPGASLFVPFTLTARAKKTIRVMFNWYVPETDLHAGTEGEREPHCDPENGCCNITSELGVTSEKPFTGNDYKPWYVSKFSDVFSVADYFVKNYDDLKKNSSLFRDAFYASTLPNEILEAVAANLTILKSPTVLRQFDGRLWSWEGCSDNNGCCHGSCTHVWNYAQAIPHLFPALERTLRHTEFCEDQNAEGHQAFRTTLPIRVVKHDFYAAADGQLGGIMKVYRDWRISGDHAWLKKMYPLVKTSMDYCIRSWDPRHKGVLEEPHHNTYDIEFWGADGMCSSFYLGALVAMTKMSDFLQKDSAMYLQLYTAGKKVMENELFNGEYFFQKIQTDGLTAPNPVDASAKSYGGEYSDEAKALLSKEGPKYQYGNGCLSDGVLGSWIAAVCGLENPLDADKTRSHLLAVHKYNLKKDLSAHANPQRPSFAMGDEGGLLLCSWPKGGKLSLPFVYSDEVWTGIEYQVASHLALTGNVKEALEVVRTCRDRYDGRTRNPFNEYECGHWYARALSSYGLLQGLTGTRYDAVDKTLYIDSKVGDFTCFLSTQTGFGTVSLQSGKPSVNIVYGQLDITKFIVSGKEVKS